MDLIPFVAHSAADAATQIRNRLGPDAVVVHVRALPNGPLQRLLGRPKFEVLACKPEPQAPRLDLRSDAPAIPDAPNDTEPSVATAEAGATELPGTGPARDANGWHIGEILLHAGFTPLSAQRVLDSLQQRLGTCSNRSVPEELQATREVLAGLWRRAPELLGDSIRPHVFVGPPGVGKTTCLAKWLTQAALVEGRPAHVWRLDGATANTAESLEVHCQALGVSVDRSWTVPNQPDDRVHFIDLPGTPWRDPAALQELARQTRSCLSPRIHLVLNAAYDTHLLLQQVRAYALLPIEDLILTHLDEESRWGKVWNLVLGTNFPIRFLSAGQNIPGDFLPATPEQLFARHFKS